MIKITIFLSVGLNVAMAVIMLIAGTYVGGAIFLLFAVLNGRRWRVWFLTRVCEVMMRYSLPMFQPSSSGLRAIVFHCRR